MLQLVHVPTEPEIKYITKTGHARQEAQLALGSWTPDPYGQRVENHIEGFAAECYGARTYDTRPDPNIGRWDGGKDLQVAGLRVSVKATKLWYDPCFLIVCEKYDWPLRCDAILLARMDWPRRVEIAGWISRDDFIAKHEIRTFDERWGPTRCVNIELLEDPELLVWHALV